MTTTETAEHAAMARSLAFVRRHVLAQVEGLDDAQLRTPVLPSGWSILGLIRHLTLSDERYWFEYAIAGGSLDYWPEGKDADWLVASSESSAEVLQAYRDAIAESERVFATVGMDDAPQARDDWWPDGGFATVRQIMLHVLVETSTHAGHLDAARELIDGRQFLTM